MKAILLALLLSGCSVFGPESPYIWFDTGRPKLDRVVWEKHSREHIRHACNFSHEIGSDMFAGCAIRLANSGQPYCLVLSTLSEKEAETVYEYGVSHREHEEEWHCKKALNHWRA